MDSAQLRKLVKDGLQDAFGKRLRGVILYGSEVRGEAQPDSDIDFLVLLEGPTDHWEDSLTCINALYDLVLEIERPIHAKPVDVALYELQQSPLHQMVRREGITA